MSATKSKRPEEKSCQSNAKVVSLQTLSEISVRLDGQIVPLDPDHIENLMEKSKQGQS